MWRTVWAIVLILTGSLAANLSGQQWPQWRGPLASGVSPEQGLPVRWSDSENVAWRAPLRGLGVSSPIVWGERVFVTSQAGIGNARSGPRLVQGGDPLEVGERPLGAGAVRDGGQVSFLVSAFDRASGRPLWEFELPAEGPLPSVHEKHNLASPSPVTDGERVYAWFSTGQIAALDMAGTLVWKKHLGAEYAPFEINWGHSSSPVVYNDLLILLCYHENASYILALDSRTGAVRWKTDTEPGVISYSTPLVIETGGRAELIVNSSVGVSGHDLSTGQRLWYVEGSNQFPIPAPLFHNGVIYTSRGYRSSPYLAIRPGGKDNVTTSHVAWRVGSGAPYVSSLVQYDGLIYMIGDVGVLTVVDIRTGERVHQQRVGGVYSASPVAGDGKIYLLSEDGETIVIEAGREARILSRNKLNARQLASPAIAGGRLFIRSDEALYAIGN